MAEVFAGHVLGEHGFQKPVAVKRLLPELANDQVFVERLIGEAKLLVGMTHGNIVSVLDLAREGDDVFLVMEFVDGPSLRQLLKGTSKLSLGTATYIVQAAAAGLQFAHARPGGAIIHADISPSNLLLTTSGEVRVADFGIARREGRAGVVEGKWAYMAPEQARGEPLSPRSDVFALGVVLYELITGHHPLGPCVTPGQRDSGPIRIAPPRSIVPSVPSGLDAICMKALADCARDRYATMQHLIDALIDERFANQWREGSNDLARVIGALPSPGPASAGPRTQVTGRPLTIMTRSLISPPQRASSPQVTGGASAQQRLLGVGGRSSHIEVSDVAPTSLFEPLSAALCEPSDLVPTSPLEASESAQVESAAAVANLPFMALAPTSFVAAIPALSASLSRTELSSAHGGTSVTGATGIEVRDGRSRVWTLSVFVAAALTGAIAAVALHFAPSHEAEPGLALESSALDGGQMLATTELAAQPATPPPPSVPAPIELQPTVPQPTVPQPTAPTEVVSDQLAPASPVVPEQSAVANKHKRRSALVATKKTAALDATLRVNTHGGTWAWASVDHQKQYAPGAKFKLAAGRHTVRLANSELHLVKSCTISLTADQVVTLTVDLEEGGCDVY